MKTLFIIILVISFQYSTSKAQELQIHYDFRHSTHPSVNPKNFPLLVFKYFKEIDTLGTGSFLFEMQSFLNGNKGFIGQTFIQSSQSLRFWKPKVYLTLNFSGGLGIAPPVYGFYISNSYGVGLSVPLVQKNSWYSFGLLYRYSDLAKPSHDIQTNIYIGGGLFNYKIMYSSSIVAWLTNKNDGLPENLQKLGKKIAFFADPQLWYALKNGFSIGSRLSLYYHVLNNKNEVQAYPTIGLKKVF